jgi:CP family cyanate transporter-like MFS transporter
LTSAGPPLGSRSLTGVRGLAALFVVGLALRLQLTVIGPIMPRIQDDVAIVHAAAGLLTGLPLLCMGLAAFVTSSIVRRLGTSVTVGVALALVAVAGLARAAAPTAAPIFLATFFIGIGIGVGGTSAPVFIKERFSGRPASATGVHVMAIILGSVLVASTAVPIAQGLGSWRWPLAIASLATIAAAAAWLVLTARATAAPPPASRPRGVPWRSRTTWLLVTIFALQSILFFGLATWLPAAFVERGWPEAEAANLIAIMIAFGLAGSLGFGWLADRMGSRRQYLVGCSIAALVCLLGLLVVPEAARLWAAVSGVGLGALFSLALTLPLDASAQAADVGPLTGLMLGVGYLISAGGPVVTGAARDLVGSFSASLGLLAVMATVLLGASMLLTDARLAAGRSAGRRADPGSDPGVAREAVAGRGEDL